MKNCLFIPTLPKFLDILRPVITSKSSKAVLFNPNNEAYHLIDKQLYYKNNRLSEDDLNDLAANNENKPIREQLLIYAMFGFLYFENDLRNRSKFYIDKIQMNKYFGTSSGEHGFNLYEKLHDISNHVYGIIWDNGVYPIFNIEEHEKNIVVESVYFHTLLNMMIEEISLQDNGKFYTDAVNTSILLEKNKNSALIAVELASLLARCKKSGKPHIAVESLILRIESLTTICFFSDKSTSYKNKVLKKAFSEVVNILTCRTCYSNEIELNIPISEINMKNLKFVININRKKHN